MTTRNYTDERRWAKFDLSESRTRIRQHVKSPYEFVFGAMIYCFMRSELELALLLKTHLRCVEEEDRSCELCSAKAEEERKEAA